MLATLKAVPLSPSPSSAHHHLRLPSLERRVNNVKERFSVYLTSKNVLKQVLGTLTCIFIRSFVITVSVYSEIYSHI